MIHAASRTLRAATLVALIGVTVSPTGVAAVDEVNGTLVPEGVVSVMPGGGEGSCPTQVDLAFEVEGYTGPGVYNQGLDC